MRFIFNILFLVGALSGAFYYFFHDTPLWKNFFPDRSVNGSQPVKTVALQIVIQKREDVARTLNRTDLQDAYLQALDVKYQAILNKVGVAKLESFLASEKSGLPTYLRTHDTNNNDRLELAELKKAEWGEGDFTFPFIDRNNDKGISAQEYWAHLKITQSRWFKHNDKNNDSVLSKAEYDDAFPDRAANAKAFAKRLDANRNAYLDDNELEDAKLIFQLR